MSSSTRSRRAVIALILTVWSQACVVHRPIPVDGSLQAGSDVRIRSTVPFEVTRQIDTLPATTSCCMTAVEGRFLRAAGDTVVLQRGSGDAVMSNMTRIPGQHESLKIVPTPGAEVTVRQIDRARTTALVIGITAAVIGLLAYAASQITYSFPNGTGY